MVDTEQAIAGCNPAIAAILDKALTGGEVSTAEGELLLTVTGSELAALAAVADHLRREKLGDRVTYVVNRNINFTNVCVKRCGFCAFSRGHRAEEGYFLPADEVVRRAREAWDLGATEVCVQAGLPPRMKGSLHIDLCRAIKAAVPNIHIHGFSPEEVKYGSELSGCTVEYYLAALKEAGVGSLPGTSAEILDDRIRNIISPGRISTAEWIRVITCAHRLGIPTSSTIMYGHIESARDAAQHIGLLRDIQKQTGGFTEFVPLSFIHTEAPMYRKSLVPGIRAGATEDEVLRMYAVARLMLHGAIHHVQASWVKQGVHMAQRCLGAGADDLGGTLLNESISTAAGAAHGHFLRPAEMRNLIRGADRKPAQRSTTYQLIREFEREPDAPESLDAVASEERFGSYASLISSAEFRFVRKAP
ncbi:MAG: 5-amino-6-(D-ribitylamino)uracil--L-tyrosine 4-hydroxyphenyl transferase CofH [Bryobacterales bacterium]|nr:5-amino-6-(D-ribitylamino)uracil--L-tyrosine 4-hydroxyphenyl transferase CofH [Bryobacterales bacterium]